MCRPLPALALALSLLALALGSFGCEPLASNSGEDTVAEAWVASYDGSTGDDSCQTIAVDGADNVYVAGCTCADVTSCDYVTLKYDASGNRLWVARYDGPASDRDCALDMTIDASGQIYVAGSSVGDGTQEDYATVKYDADGNRLWVARYDGPASGMDLASATVTDYSGDVCVTGWSEGNGTEEDYATVKYDGDGRQLWAARYNGPVGGEDRSLAITVDGWANLYVTGWSHGNGTDADYTTIKYDRDGNRLWLARYDGPVSGEDKAQAIAVDDWGSVYVTGRSQGNGTGADYATVKYDGNGNELWVARHDGPARGDDSAQAVVVDVWGAVYVTGWSHGDGTAADYATVKYNASGEQVWSARYDGPAYGVDDARAIGIDVMGNIYVTGWSRGKRAGYDFATVKYDGNGKRLWVARYDGPEGGHDQAYALAIDSSGNPCVTGKSSGSSGFYDCATVKYVQ